MTQRSWSESPTADAKTVPRDRAATRHLGLAQSPAEDLLHLIGAFVDGLAVEALAGENLDALNRCFGLLLKVLLAGLGTR